MKRVFLLSLLCAACISLGFPRDLKRGYRGFVECDNTFGKTDFWNDEIFNYDRGNLYFLGISTSHGFQFNPSLYVGGGCMLACACPSGDITIPFFADIRYDAKFSKVTPFTDLRGGIYLDSDTYGGFYVSPTVGYCFQHAKKVNYSLGVGVTLREVKVSYYPFTESQRKVNTLLTIRFGIDFK